MRDIPLELLDEMFATTTGEVFLVILEIQHPNLEEPIRYVKNTETITHLGNDYIPHPFAFRPPKESTDRLQRVRLSLDVIDSASIRAWSRSTMTTARCVIKIIAASQPDLALVTWRYNLKRRTLDNAVLEVELSLDDEIGRKYPDGKITAGTVPGVFR